MCFGLAVADESLTDFEIDNKSLVDLPAPEVDPDDSLACSDVKEESFDVLFLPLDLPLDLFLE